jgi:hypothetical protein
MALLVVVLSSCGTVTIPGAAPTSPPPTPTFGSQLAIASSAFEPGGAIPSRYTCFGQNLSPPLEGMGVPESAQGLVLLVDDPDSSPPGFVHWVIYNIPPTTTGLPEGVPPETALQDGSLQGKNDYAPFGGGTFPGGVPINLIGYDGPCPPEGEHRYVFTLYALDALLDLPAEATMEEVKEAMAQHVLAQAEVLGRFAPP